MLAYRLSDATAEAHGLIRIRDHLGVQPRLEQSFSVYAPAFQLLDGTNAVGGLVIICGLSCPAPTFGAVAMPVVDHKLRCSWQYLDNARCLDRSETHTRDLGMRSTVMERFKTRILQQRAGNFGRSAKWSWDVYELRYRNQKIVGCGTCENEERARDAAARAIADFLETETWGIARRRA